MRAALIPGLLVMMIIVAGCAGQQAKSSYSVDNRGVLSLSCVPVPVLEQEQISNETYSSTRILLRSPSADVVTYLAAPDHPRAAVVYVPGAGEKPAGHESRMVQYANAGYAFLFVDIRGNGGETPGYQFNPDRDFTFFENGEWPQYYLTVCDLVNARQMLAAKFHIPVYIMGSSNGGRYAAVAAGVNPEFAGYIGVSTSDWGVEEYAIRQDLDRDIVRFASSIEPGTYIGTISPRPVWIFHSRGDQVIPFENGRRLFELAKEPKTFIEFSGDHGINTNVDDAVLMQWAQIYGTRG